MYRKAVMCQIALHVFVEFTTTLESPQIKAEVLTCLWIVMYRSWGKQFAL